MSLGIVFKGPEGIVLAADTRVTLNMEAEDPEGNRIVMPAYFDNATKLLQFQEQPFIGAVTYGLGALEYAQGPRTAHSFIPEFEDHLKKKAATDNQGRCQRIGVRSFARQLSEFFMERWEESNAPSAAEYSADPMVFLIGGFDDGAPYGRAFEVKIPSEPGPVEHSPGDNVFGLTYGGQKQIAERLLQGFDSALIRFLQENTDLDEDRGRQLHTALKGNLALPIPYQFLPLQDCVSLAVVLIDTTTKLQQWTMGVRGVGGLIEVATITRTDGFEELQVKKLGVGKI